MEKSVQKTKIKIKNLQLITSTRITWGWELPILYEFIQFDLYENDFS